MRIHYVKLRGLIPYRNEAFLDLDALPGKVTAIVGENGAGKTVLVESMAAAVTRTYPSYGSLVDQAMTRDSFLEVGVSMGKRYNIRQLVDGQARKNDTVLMDDRYETLKDAAGHAIVDKGKVTQFKDWVADHFPPNEVIYNSMFAPQGSAGFLKLGAADQKTILLRVKGLDRYEKLAKRAGEIAGEASTRLDVILAQIGEISQSGDVAKAGEDLDEAQQLLSLTQSAATRAKSALEIARQVESTAKLEIERNRQQRERYDIAQAAMIGAQARRTETQRLLDEARALIADREAVDCGIARASELNILIARLAQEQAALKQSIESLSERLVALEREIVTPTQALAAARKRLADAITILVDKPFVDAAKLNQGNIAARVAGFDGALRSVQEAIAKFSEVDHELDGWTAQLSTLTDQREQAVTANDQALRVLAESDRILLSKPAIDDAVRQVPILKRQVDDLDAAVKAADVIVEELQEKRSATKDERIVGLRTGLGQIRAKGEKAEPATGEDAAECIQTAGLTLDNDEHAEKEAEDRPEQLRRAQEEVGAAKLRLKQARAAHAEAVELAGAAPRIQAAEQNRAGAIEIRDQANELIPQADIGIERLRGLIVERQTANATKQQRLTELTREREAAENNLATARREEAECLRLVGAAAGIATAETTRDLAADEERQLLAQIESLTAIRTEVTESRRLKSVEVARKEAESRQHTEELGGLADIIRRGEEFATAEQTIRQLEPKLEIESSEVERTTAEFTPLVRPGEDPAIPPLTEFEEALEFAGTELNAAHASLGIAQRNLEAAQKAETRLKALRAEKLEAETDLADFTRLQADYGKKRLQALEADAAGPELSELANDLLQSCFGSRFVVSIETTRESKGKQIEDCYVSVQDTESGRKPADGKLKSGGQKVFIGEAIALALSIMACRHAGVEAPTLVRDESGGALSPKYAPRYITMLRRAASIVGASRVLIISHTPEAWEMADSIVHVSETGTIEQVTYEEAVRRAHAGQDLAAA